MGMSKTSMVILGAWGIAASGKKGMAFSPPSFTTWPRLPPSALVAPRVTSWMGCFQVLSTPTLNLALANAEATLKAGTAAAAAAMSLGAGDMA
ncbi:MAG: hypothetical protein A4E43_01316 [Methanosaeta sp. PtaB.Bin005]|nr:MAG: hypothetical protein A4E43_01316 [Methanosaeta sp. PtaB.Bin005]